MKCVKVKNAVSTMKEENNMAINGLRKSLKIHPLCFLLGILLMWSLVHTISDPSTSIIRKVQFFLLVLSMMFLTSLHEYLRNELKIEMKEHD